MCKQIMCVVYYGIHKRGAVYFISNGKSFEEIRLAKLSLRGKCDLYLRRETGVGGAQAIEFPTYAIVFLSFVFKYQSMWTIYTNISIIL